MSLSGIDAIRMFLDERKGPTPHDGRLVIEKNQILFKKKNEISPIALMRAKMGFGKASFRRVIAHINQERDKVFSKGTHKSKEVKEAWEKLNQFIGTYNEKRILPWKRAKRIQAVISDLVIGIDLKGSLTNRERLLLISYRFKKCQKALDPKALNTAFKRLAEASLDWTPTPRMKNRTQYRKEKALLNEILNFKNEVRAACIQQGKRPLKGPKTTQDKLLAVEDQEELKANLKKVREVILKKHFKGRLEKDEAKLAQLWLRFSENKEEGSLKDQSAFLENQLKRWQKKLDQGKPLSLPWMYHCTKDISLLEKILDTFILNMYRGFFPGCFVANIPEHTYGNYCIALSDHIVVTGTKNPKSKIPVYPTYSQLNAPKEYPIYYSDVPLAPQTTGFNNHQEGVGIWLGFQRGSKTLNKKTGMGTEGIPLKCLERINTDRPLCYYKDTSVAFIFSRSNDQKLLKLGHERRIQVLEKEQVGALRSLINATFLCTLPKQWKYKLKSATSIR